MKLLAYLLTIIIILAVLAIAAVAICLLVVLGHQFPVISTLVLVVGAPVVTYLASYVWGQWRKWFFWVSLFLSIGFLCIFLPAVL